MMNIRRLLAAALGLALAACGGAGTLDGPAGAGPDPDPGFPTQPPSPAAVEDVVFPEYDERVLSTGARLIVVENHEQPVVTVQLMMPGGSAADPAGMPGLASVTAALIDKGTGSMTARELAEAIDFLGASLRASASSEWTSIQLTTLTDFLDRGLQLMSDVVLDPVFPDDELATEKQRRVSSLRLQKSQPASLAQEAFMEGIYGDHPYGRTESVESIEALSTAAVQGFHSRFYRPDGALFVVAGDVDPDRVAADLEAAFSGWEGRPAVEEGRTDPPTRTSRKLLFVHKPGSVQAVIRIGHLFPSATSDDWVVLDVANQVLGSGSAGFSAWMMKILRDQKGYTYGARSTMSERQGPGYFVMNGEFRNEVADSSLMIMLELAERLRQGDIPAEDLEGAKLYLTGSFPLGIETPQQVAGQVATNRLLGRPDSYLTEYRGGVEAVDADDVARIARRHIHPDRMLIVVVGDGTAVLDQLRPFADEVEAVDAEGEPVDLDALAASRASATLAYDASALQPREMRYGVMFQGSQIGTVLTRWTRDGSAFVVVTEQELPGLSVQQTTEFDAPSFTPVRTTLSTGTMGEFGFEIREGRAVGRGMDPQTGPRDVDVALGPATAFEDQFDVALALTDFADAGEMTLELLTSAGTLQEMSAAVDGQETVEVPAGTFETYRLEISGPQPVTVWVTEAAPHIVVKREITGQPVTIELLSM